MCLSLGRTGQTAAVLQPNPRGRRVARLALEPGEGLPARSRAGNTHKRQAPVLFCCRGDGREDVKLRGEEGRALDRNASPLRLTGRVPALDGE
ncbi:hypothetical protein AAFF_G00035700 [Aldrovandia affinis]|uniref:Uncharacterized protein n=1 Tax=Aldrovandia affinis TaxID=143900 RepID=A0AAD7WGH6_9TELE|nr:hypothetical protein AAFF_G00035700 [Aldrovandia affinis]